MALYSQLSCKLRPTRCIRALHSIRTSSTLPSNDTEIEEEFRVFDIRSGKTKQEEKIERYVKPPNLPPREKSMPVDQDWPSVWPGPRSFHPASVPLPVRQGHDKRNKRAPPAKYANTELMKIPNFLHLTPPAIKRHCDVLKKFCTPWPQGLETNKDIEKHFPVEVLTTDYCFSSPKIKDPKARIVSLTYPLSRLGLNEHSKDKIQRLLGERYNSETGKVTLVSDRCPSRKQNYDYNKYLLVATFFEASNVEPWEAEKGEEDMEYYRWDVNKSKKAYLTAKYWPGKVDEKMLEMSLEDDELAQEYKKAVTKLFDDGDTIENIHDYKEAAVKLLFN